MKEPQDGCDTGCGENKLLPAESGKQKYATRAITFLRWTEHNPKQLINTTYWDPEQNPTRHWFASRLRSCPLLCSARKKIPFGVTKIIFQWSEKHSSNNQSMSFTLVFLFFDYSTHFNFSSRQIQLSNKLCFWEHNPIKASNHWPGSLAHSYQRRPSEDQRCHVPFVLPLSTSIRLTLSIAFILSFSKLSTPVNTMCHYVEFKLFNFEVPFSLKQATAAYWLRTKCPGSPPCSFWKVKVLQTNSPSWCMIPYL